MMMMMLTGNDDVARLSDCSAWVQGPVDGTQLTVIRRWVVTVAIGEIDSSGQ